MASILKIHNKNNFIVPIRQFDVEIFIKDVNGKQTNAINPLNVTFLYTAGVEILIKMKSTDNITKIDFSTNSEAIDAMEILKKAIDVVVSNISNSHASSSFYHHVQLTASTTWSFTHNLHRKTEVNILEIDYSTKMFGVVNYPTLDTVVIHFNSPVNGHAWI